MSETLIVKRPVVASASQKTPVAAAGAALAMIGLGVFLFLSSARASLAESEDSLPALAATTSTDLQGTVPAMAVPAQTPAPAASPFFIPNSGPVPLVASTPPRNTLPTSFAPRSGYAPTTPVVDPLIERMRAPALVVDLAQADMARFQGSGQVTRSDSGQDIPAAQLPPIPMPPDDANNSSATAAGAAGAPGAGPANDRNLSDTERFSARVGGEEVEVAQARRMARLDRLVPQGAVIGAVMETALNSDQPGFARALTQRDMYSFDGSAILIPAGSRLIGQYKSGVAQGASRLFVLWTRLIRPDGVSIELASPATDDLGRGGIGGKVNRHFVQRFGGAILTSVLSGGISAATASLSGGSTILVGSAGQASTLASQATQTADIPPTITTRQGAAVRVFVARDLDFTRVGPAR
ncbi:MAG: type VI secretion protein [Pseudomonadota bacterium]|nr:type VI secretion protein [Pseudomonadota bacterium]